jgi:hypothetical protein
MKRPTPSLSSALAKKAPDPVPETPAPSVRRVDDRINTTLRLAPSKLEQLKILAARRRVRVNDLVLEGVDHVLALGQKSAA